jgi:hypothetical protein
MFGFGGGGGGGGGDDGQDGAAATAAAAAAAEKKRKKKQRNTGAEPEAVAPSAILAKNAILTAMFNGSPDPTGLLLLAEEKKAPTGIEVLRATRTQPLTSHHTQSTHTNTHQLITHSPPTHHPLTNHQHIPSCPVLR